MLKNTLILIIILALIAVFLAGIYIGKLTVLRQIGQEPLALPTPIPTTFPLPTLSPPPTLSPTPTATVSATSPEPF